MSKVYSPKLDRFQEIRSTLVCPGCGSDKRVVKMGFRKTKEKGRVQRYLCKTCNKRFSLDPMPRSKYKPRIKAFALSYFNIGHTLEETQRTIKRTYKTQVPLPTLHDWTQRHKDICTFIPLRKKYNLDWRTAIKTKKLHHQQVYHFKFHHLKTNFASKTFPILRKYLWEVYETDNSKIFTNSTLRCSSFKPDDISLVNKAKTKEIVHNNATEMTGLALALAKNRGTRHETIEDFFLKNDSKTVAVEVPVFITPQESKSLRLSDTLTGHIDILQVRNNKIFIMDYKPEQSFTNAIAQLWLYRISLAARTGIPLKRIGTAAFNENKYVEISYPSV